MFNFTNGNAHSITRTHIRLRERTFDYGNAHSNTRTHVLTHISYALTLLHIGYANASSLSAACSLSSTCEKLRK